MIKLPIYNTRINFISASDIPGLGGFPLTPFESMIFCPFGVRYLAALPQLVRCSHEHKPDIHVGVLLFDGEHLPTADGVQFALKFENYSVAKDKVRLVYTIKNVRNSNWLILSFDAFLLELNCEVSLELTLELGGLAQGQADP